MMTIGQAVGDYVIASQLAQGGMGTIFTAVHQQTGRRVVVKALHPHLSQDEQITRRFLNEARAAAAIHHPGVVEVLECGQLADGTLYILMEHLPGESLGERLRRDGRMPVAETVGLGLQIAQVLRVTHEAGIIHRDLKPDNVMIVPGGTRASPGGAQGGAAPPGPADERARLLDFGIAKLRPEQQAEDGQVHTRAGTLMGTPEFMAPEQIYEAGNVDGKADVYSLGVLLYRMLSGQLPFAGEWSRVILMQVHAAPPPLPALVHGLPAGLAALVHAMLRKSPSDRPTMAEVAQALRRQWLWARTRRFLLGNGRWALAAVLGVGTAALIVLLNRC